MFLRRNIIKEVSRTVNTSTIKISTSKCTIYTQYQKKFINKSTIVILSREQLYEIILDMKDYIISISSRKHEHLM